MRDKREAEGFSRAAWNERPTVGRQLGSSVERRREYTFSEHWILSLSLSVRCLPSLFNCTNFLFTLPALASLLFREKLRT